MNPNMYKISSLGRKKAKMKMMAVQRAMGEKNKMQLALKVTEKPEEKKRCN